MNASGVVVDRRLKVISGLGRLVPVSYAEDAVLRGFRKDFLSWANVLLWGVLRGVLCSPFPAVRVWPLCQAVLVRTPWRSEHNPCVLKARSFRTFGPFLGRKSCRSERFARMRILRPPRMFFRVTGFFRRD